VSRRKASIQSAFRVSNLALILALSPYLCQWNDSWSFGLQRAAYSAALTFFLATGRLIKKEQVAQILDSESTLPHGYQKQQELIFTPSSNSIVRSEESHKFQISTEEYLHSLVSVINELSRLAVNSVTLGE
jgi:hypothetical protein